MALKLNGASMGTVLAIAGRHSTGKTFLLEKMVKLGVQKTTNSFEAGVSREALNILIARCKKKPGLWVAEIPSRLTTSLWRDLHWDAIIVVDCPDDVQQKYADLCKKNAKKDLHTRQHYNHIATDVFLNTVSSEQVDWVAEQLVTAYQLEV